MEDAGFNVLPSVSWKEKIFIVLQRGSHPVQTFIAVQLARMSNQIFQDQGNVLLKMYDNLQSAWKHK